MRSLFNTIHTKTIVFGLGMILTVLGVFGTLLVPAHAFAAEGDIVITVQDELGNSLSGASVTAECTRYDKGTPMGPYTSNGSGQVTISQATAVANGCDENGDDIHYPTDGAGTGNADSITVSITKDGYVSSEQSFSTVWHDHNNPGASITATGVEFAVKVSVEDELGNAFTDSGSGTVRTGNGANTHCTHGSGGNWYCAVPLGDTITDVVIAKEGFVQKTIADAWSDRTAHSDAQETVTVDDENSGGMQYAHKISVTDELGDSLSGATVTGGVGNTNCVADSDDYYCPIPASSDGSGTYFTVTKDGFVRKSDVAVGNRVNDASPQQTASTSLLYAVKVSTTVQNELGGSLSPDSIYAGDDFEVDCEEDSGSYYCAVPLADTNTVVRVVKDGYVSATSSSFSDRTQHSDGQRVIDNSISLNYAYVVDSITNELANSIIATATTVELGDSSGLNACTKHTDNKWYCPVTLTNSNGTIIARVQHDGYVEQSNYATSNFSSRNDDTDPQDSGSVNDVLFAYKLDTFTAEATDADLATSVSAVSVGTSGNQTTCTESDDVWYCAVPLANSDGSVYARFEIDGFVNEEKSVTSRSSHTTAQRTPDVTGIKYAYRFEVEDELDNSLSGVSVKSNDGNAWNIDCVESGSYYYCAVPINSPWGSGADNYTFVSATKDGYVTKSRSTDTLRTAHTDGQVQQTVEDVLFSHKITVTREGDDAALTGASVTTTDTVCEEGNSDGIYYCPVELADDGNAISISKSGYVTDTSVTATARDTNESGQVVLSKDGILFQLKVFVKDELGADVDISDLDVDGIYVTDGEDSDSPTYSTSTVAYFAAELSGDTLVVEKDGYVSAQTTNEAFEDVTTNSSAQTVVTMGDYSANNSTITSANNPNNAKGLVFAQKVTVTRAGDNANLNTSVVTAGISSEANLGAGVTCVQADPIGDRSGQYFCAVPVSNQNTKTYIQTPGYVSQQVTFTPRESIHDGQKVLTAVVLGQGDNQSVTPQVISQNPSYDTDISTTVQPTIVFSSPMNSGTLNSQTIQLLKAEYGEGVYGEQVPATILYNSYTNSVTIQPHQALERGATYWIYVSGARDSSGNYVTVYNGLNGYDDNFMDAEYEGDSYPANWFTVAEASEFTASLTNISNGADNVSINILPTIQFSIPVESRSFTNTKISLWTYVDSEKDEQIEADVVALNGNSVARIEPREALEYGTTYLVEASYDVTSSEGTTLGENYQIVFTTGSEPTGELAVTGISAIKTFATANNSFDDGFEWVFDVTAPIDENLVQVKFSNFVSGSNTLAAANNIRYCTVQSGDDCVDAGWKTVTAADTYGNAIGLVSDLSAATEGRQIKLKVQLKVPENTPGGSYSASYGITTDEAQP